MKLVSGKAGLVIRLGVLVTAMLFGQQAMAVGTRANTLIENTATVDYDVATVAQTQLTSNTVQFVVDRRVDFDIAPVGAALVPVTPGGNDYFFDFLLTNTSNSVLDFSVSIAQMVGGLVRGQTDDANMAIVDYAVSASPVSGSDDDPVRLGLQFVDELEADDAIRIRVFGDAGLAMVVDEIAGVDIVVTGGEPGGIGVEGAALVDGLPNTDLGVENVFADAGGDNSETDRDGFIVASADLAVTKSYAVIAGDLGSGLPIPGATIEYTIEIVNSSTTTSADDIEIGDVLDSDVTLVLGGYPGAEDMEYTNGVVVTQCSAAVDGDDCQEVAGVITVGAGGTIDLAASTTLTLTYQVLIPDPALTP